jgi:hypothetical protein
VIMKKEFLLYLLLGLLALAISIVLSLTLFAPTHGFAVDVGKAPAEVKAILSGKPKGEPLTKQELDKINRLLSQHDPSSNQKILNMTIKNGWILFFLVPGIFAAACLFVVRKTKKLSSLIFLPSLLFILAITVIT